MPHGVLRVAAVAVDSVDARVLELQRCVRIAVPKLDPTAPPNI